MKNKVVSELKAQKRLLKSLEKHFCGDEERDEKYQNGEYPPLYDEKGDKHEEKSTKISSGESVYEGCDPDEKTGRCASSAVSESDEGKKQRVSKALGKRHSPKEHRKKMAVVVLAKKMKKSKNGMM